MKPKMKYYFSFGFKKSTLDIIKSKYSFLSKLSLYILLLIANALSAQRPLNYITYKQRSDVNFTNVQTEKVNRIISNPMYKAHYYVGLNAIPTFSIDGTLTINLPKSNANFINQLSNDIDNDGITNINDVDKYDPCVPNSISQGCTILLPTDFEYLTFHAVNIEIESETDYMYYGQLDPCDWKLGYILIMAKDGKVFGQINYENDVYEIIDLGSNQQIMVYLNQSDVKETQCHNPLQESNVTNENLNLRISSGCNTRVLVLYLDEAEQIADPVSKARLVIEQSNQIAGNSKANVGFSLAGVAKVTGLSNTTDASDFFEELMTNQNIKNLRNTFQADLVALFTQRHFQNTDENPFAHTIIGWSGLAKFDNPDFGYFYCNIDAASASFTFTHEMAHDFGCMHDRGNPAIPIPPFVKSAQGFLFSQGCCWPFTPERRTNMAILGGDQDFSRIMNWSNPDVKFKGKKTGVVNERNNAAQMSSMACIVSNYRPYNPPFSTKINGPTEASNGDLVEYCITIESCDNASSIQWSYSLDGIHYTNVQGNSLCMSFHMATNGTLYIKSVVYCGTTKFTSFFKTYNSNDPRFNGDCTNGSPAKIDEQAFDFLILQNPVLNNLNIEIGGKNDIIRLEIIDACNKSWKITDVKSNLLSLPLSNLPSGVYLVKIKNVNGLEKTKKFVKI